MIEVVDDAFIGLGRLKSAHIDAIFVFLDGWIGDIEVECFD